MKILIVDDDLVDRELIVRSLRQSENPDDLVEASTVDEGLLLYNEDSFDIVLLDYKMPQRDGIEMILELRNKHQDSCTAIVMMSSSQDEQLAIECIKAGAQDYLIKSEITTARLKRALIHAKARFELERELYKSYIKAKDLAESDSLTGLANRYLFEESLKISIDNNSRHEHKLSLILIDLDHFKLINDTYGHDTGDALLKQVTTRIKNCLRGHELFARLGGDEFAITIANLESVGQVSRIARRIISTMAKPFEIGNSQISTSASIGIAIHPDNGTTGEELFKFADIAMYRSKKLGRNQVCFFESNMQKQFVERYHLEQELQQALKKEQFRLHYQPILDADTLTVIGFEALIRWDIYNGVRSPDKFIPIAEETRLIIEIGRWVIREAINTVSTLNRQYNKHYCLSINLSAVQLGDSGLTAFIQQCLIDNRVSPETIEFELTETALIDDTHDYIKTIKSVHELGCKIALDDFGTGFSSVSHLNNFPIDTVKIDKSLMPQGRDSLKCNNLVRGLVSMIQYLGLNIVAEGVETESHYQLCKDLHVGRVQGFHFSKPIPRDQLIQRYFC